MPKNSVPPESIPEVIAYTEAKEMLEAFIGHNARVFSTYFSLLDSLSQKREAADKLVRGKEVSCSDWELYQYHTKVNAEAMFNALGMEQFLRFGGTTTTKTIYDADKARVEAAIAKGEISQELGKIIIEKSPRYHAPK